MIIKVTKNHTFWVFNSPVLSSFLWEATEADTCCFFLIGIATDGFKLTLKTWKNVELFQYWHIKTTLSNFRRNNFRRNKLQKQDNHGEYSFNHDTTLIWLTLCVPWSETAMKGDINFDKKRFKHQVKWANLPLHFCPQTKLLRSNLIHLLWHQETIQVEILCGTENRGLLLYCNSYVIQYSEYKSANSSYKKKKFILQFCCEITFSVQYNTVKFMLSKDIQWGFLQVHYLKYHIDDFLLKFKANIASEFIG